MKKRTLSLILIICLTLALVPFAPSAGAATGHIELIPPKYDDVRNFSDGMAAVSVGEWIDVQAEGYDGYQYTYRDYQGKWGFIDKTGNEVIPCKYEFVGDFSNGVAYVSIGEGETGESYYIDKTGAKAENPPGTPAIFYGHPEWFDKYYTCVWLNENMVKVSLDGLNWGLCDAEGNEITPPNSYYAVGEFCDGLAMVIKMVDDGWSRKFGFIDGTGTEVVPLTYDDAYDFTEGFARVALKADDGFTTKYGFIDKSGKVFVPVEYDLAADFSEGLAMVGVLANDDLYNPRYNCGYIDTTGKVAIPLEYEGAGNFSEGLAFVGPTFLHVGEEGKDRNQYGYINKDGVEVVPAQYNAAKAVSEGLAAVGIGAYEWEAEGGNTVHFEGKWGFISVDSNAAPTDPLDTASGWAKESIVSAISKGFVPEDLQGNYTKTITRQEFCRLAVKYMEYASGKSIDALLTEKGLARNEDAFTDTTDADILAAYALGVTSGSGEGTFTPNGQFTRESAAQMIMNVRKALGYDVSNPPPSAFTDAASISEWTKAGVDYCAATGIMSGSGGVFNPKGTFTREMSIMTFDNMEA